MESVSNSHARLRVYECDIHFMYVGDAGYRLQLNRMYNYLCQKLRCVENCRIERIPLSQTHQYIDPLYLVLRDIPVCLTIETHLNRVLLDNSYRYHAPLLTRVTLHETGFVSIRQTLLLKDIDLDCLGIVQALSLNQTELKISCPLLGCSRMTLDEYTWKLFEKLEKELELHPRVPIKRPGELERVLVLRRLSGNPDADSLLTTYAPDLASMIGRLRWYEDQSRQFQQVMTDDALVLHRYLLVLCKWQGKLIYYSNTLPDAARAWWSDTEFVDIFETLLVQFFALRMYNLYLEKVRTDVEKTLLAVAKTNKGSLGASVRQDAVSSLLRVEAIRAEVELSVHETQHCLVSLSYHINQVVERYDKAIGLRKRLDVVKTKLDDLERINNVIVRTLTQQVSEAVLQASLRETKTLRLLTWLLLAVAVVSVVGIFWNPVSHIITWLMDVVF